MKTFNDNFSAQTNEQAESKITSLLANSRQDNVLVESKVVPLQELTGLSSRRGLENAIICENQIVNVVSNSYGHLPNEKFFLGVEEKLIDADIYYQQRSINRDNRSFVVDYILADDRYKVEVKGDKVIEVHLRPNPDPVMYDDFWPIWSEDQKPPFENYVRIPDADNETEMGRLGFYVPKW